MAYPRQLNLDAATEQKLITYIESEMLNHDAERGPFSDRLNRWQRDYWAEPLTEENKFPFKGASNIVIPLTAIAVEAIHARTNSVLYSLGQFISVKAQRSDWQDYAKANEEYLNQELLVEMRIQDSLDSAILECEKFGTGIATAKYDRLIRYAVRDNPDGTTTEYPVTIKDGALIESTPLGRFIMPFSEQNSQTASWCGEDHSESPYTIWSYEASGLFRAGTLDKLKPWVVARSADDTQANKQRDSQEDLEKRKAIWPKRIDWKEIWLAFPTEENGVPREIVVHYHRGAQCLMSVRYNWHEDLHRPYRHCKYFPVEHRWYGIGIAKQNEQFQKEITTQHRQRLDNATIANMKMFKISKLSGYQPGEPIFPGKMWFLDDMDHIDVLPMGEINASSFNNEQATALWSQQRTGVNEATLGQPQAGTPGTATAALANIQESNKKFELSNDNIKRFSHELVLDTACLIKQFGARRIERFQYHDQYEKIAAFYRQPYDVIRSGLLLKIDIAGTQQNKVLDRQNWTTLATLFNQYYAGAIQLAQLTQNPQLINLVVTRGLSAATEAMKQIAETFDARNVEKLIIPEFLAQVQQQQQLAATKDGRTIIPGNPTLSEFGLGGGESGLKFPFPALILSDTTSSNSEDRGRSSEGATIIQNI